MDALGLSVRTRMGPGAGVTQDRADLWLGLVVVLLVLGVLWVVTGLLAPWVP